MSRDLVQSTTPLTDTAQLVDYFHGGAKPAGTQLGVGTEHEKFVFRRDTGAPLSYEEQGGYGDLFATLASDHGWEPSYDQGGNIAALTRDGAALTLEPGGQFELSGAVMPTMFQTEQELHRHLQEIKDVAGDRLAFVCWGLNPFDDLEQIPWMPKPRYAIMRRYLPTRGDLAHWMMKATCTIQGNYDYTSEADAIEILRTGLLVSPIVSALCANSPVRRGQDTGMQSFRCHIWTRTDPDRTGFPDFMYTKDWGFEDYIQYVLDIPMFFIRRDDAYVDLAGTTFRDFMHHGAKGHSPTIGDFELHLSTVFPEVRLKRYIEVRGADGGAPEMIIALPTLWKGLIYDAQARQEAAALMPSDSPQEHRQCFEAVYRHGLHAKTDCGDYMELAKELVEISKRGLQRQAKAWGHRDESGFLAPFDQILSEGVSGADRRLEEFMAAGGDRMRLITQAAL